MVYPEDIKIKIIQEENKEKVKELLKEKNLRIKYIREKEGLTGTGKKKKKDNLIKFQTNLSPEEMLDIKTLALRDDISVSAAGRFFIQLGIRSHNSNKFLPPVTFASKTPEAVEVAPVVDNSVADVLDPISPGEEELAIIPKKVNQITVSKAKKKNPYVVVDPLDGNPIQCPNCGETVDFTGNPVILISRGKWSCSECKDKGFVAGGNEN